MRKFALIAAGAALAFGATAPAALAGPEEFQFNVKTSTSKAGTKTRPRANTLETEFQLKGPRPTQETQYAATRAVIFFDKAFKFNLRKFTRTCEKSTVLNNPNGCPKASRVGLGTGEAQNFATPEIDSPLDIRAFQGPNRKLYIRVETDRPAPVRGIMVGTLSRSSGLYGHKLTVVIPGEKEAAQGFGNLVEPVGGINPTLTEFLLRTGATYRNTPYIATTSCGSRKVWAFKANLTFTDGTKASDSTTVRCRR